MSLLDFKLNPKKKLSGLASKKEIQGFISLCDFIKNIQYSRISDPSDLSLIIKENQGTCSTKHAFLKAVAEENDKNEIKLIVGIFKMNKINTPVLSDILSRNNLAYVPEAHCYLKYENQRFDFTKNGVDVNSFQEDILLEKEITPEQAGQWKSDFHQQFISDWLKENKNIKYSPEEIWSIREECIKALSNNN